MDLEALDLEAESVESVELAESEKPGKWAALMEAVRESVELESVGTTWAACRACAEAGV